MGKVLQIACGVPYSSIYKNYFTNLHKRGVNFHVYIPQHKDNDRKIDEFLYEYYTSKVINKLDRILYFKKIFKMKKDVVDNIDINNTCLIHAHSLFNDGGLAYFLNKKYNIPYCVAIRDTDINKYYRIAIHLRGFATKILKNANAVIFLSNSYKEKLFNNYLPIKMHKTIEKKTHVIPNGVEDFWLENKNINLKNDFEPSVFKLLYVGQIIKRKNISTILRVANVLKDKIDKEISVTIIGEVVDEEYFHKLKLIGDFNHIPFTEKKDLLKHYRNSNVFIMPSITETFGLVYAEAMSQGLPVIYTKGQGFDQQFNDGLVGYSVNPFNVQEISSKIINIENNKDIQHNCIEKVEKFDWNNITERYLSLYKKIK